MKKIFLSMLFLLVLSGMSFALGAPNLSQSVSGNRVELNWTAVDGASGYKLYFAPVGFTSIDQIGIINMGTERSISADLPGGTNLYVGITAYEGSYSESIFSGNEGPFSNIITLTIDTSDSSVVLQTGQTTSYDASGNIVNDGSIKDDGYYQAGAPRSYSRSGDIVTDETTGLMWQDDADAVSVRKTWANAKNYCQNKTLGGYSDWRLPTIKELATIVDYGRDNPATDPVFQNANSMEYWSSTTFYFNTDLAWSISFYYGHAFDVLKDSTYSTYYVRCVRGNSLPESSFNRDQTKEVVTDKTTGLMWQDDSDVASVTKTWKGAINYCENLTLAGFTDWRLPNINELRSIVYYSEDPAIYAVFENVQSEFYWSSTTNYTDYAWDIYFYLGTNYDYDKEDNAIYVRCVRAGQ